MIVQNVTRFCAILFKLYSQILHNRQSIILFSDKPLGERHRENAKKSNQCGLVCQITSWFIFPPSSCSSTSEKTQKYPGYTKQKQKKKKTVGRNENLCGKHEEANISNNYITYYHYHYYRCSSVCIECSNSVVLFVSRPYTLSSSLD